MTIFSGGPEALSRARRNSHSNIVLKTGEAKERTLEETSRCVLPAAAEDTSKIASPVTIRVSALSDPCIPVCKIPSVFRIQKVVLQYRRECGNCEEA